MEKATKIILIFGLLVASWVIAARYEVDFRILYDTAKLTFQGHYPLIYTDDGGNGSIGRYFYGPFSLVLIDPLGALPFVYAKWIWIALQTGCFLLFWRWLPRFFPWFAEKRLHWTWFLIYVLSINPLHNNFQSNNIQLMLYTVLVAAEILSRRISRRSQFLAGALVAMAVSVKVYPLFMAAFYLISKPRSVKAGVIGGGLFCFFAPFAVFGFEAGKLLFESFLHNLTTYQVNNDLVGSVDICSLPTLIARVFQSYPRAISGKVIQAATLIISGIFFGVVYRKKLDPRSAGYTPLWAMALALMAFLNPSSRSHYYIFYLPAFASLCQTVRVRKNLWLEMSLGLSAALIALTAQGAVGKDLNDRLEALSVPTVGMAVLCLALAWEIKKSGKLLRAENQNGLIAPNQISP